jgi:hypothetical protein
MKAWLHKPIFYIAAALTLVLLIAILGLLSRRGAKTENLPSTTKTTVADKNLKGVSISPKSFQPTDYLSFFTKAKEAGNSLTWAGDWAELSNEKSAAYSISKTAKQNNLKLIPIVGLFKNVNGKAVLLRELTTANMKLYQDGALKFARENQPEYIGLGNEINILYETSPANFTKFVELFSSTYDEIKKVSPKTQVFTIFQLERLKGLKGGLFGGKNDTTKSTWSLIDEFPKADLIAFTTYPGLIYMDPKEIPTEYYTEISLYSDKPVAFTEIGWSADSKIKGWESSEEEQAAFLTRFLNLEKDLGHKFLIWPFLYDQNIGGAFTGMGLITKTDMERKVWGIWTKVK